MENAQQLYNRATDLIDENRYTEAIKLFQQALRIEVHGSALVNLSIARNLLKLQFLRELEDRYPDNTTILMERVRFDLHNQRAKTAYELCNPLIDKHKEDKSRLARLRSLRFLAASKAGISDHILEDFSEVWKSLKAGRGRQRLLQDFLSINDPKLADVFLTASKSELFSDKMRMLFAEKSHLLKILEEVEEEILN